MSQSHTAYNFAFPYFARDIGEFWRRWHISLSTWFRDYLYIPLGGSRTTSRARHLANLVATFGLSGFWHGANWTFVFWGVLNGLYYIPLVVGGQHKANVGTTAPGRLLPSLSETLGIAATFTLTLVAWVFFRADNLGHAFDYLGALMSGEWLTVPAFKSGLPYAAVLLVVEWAQRHREHALALGEMPRAAQWFIYYLVVITIFMFGNFGHVPFIYFQF